MNHRCLYVLIIMCFIISISSAADWPHWRGPNHDGISTETDWNPKLLADKKIVWEAEVGIGFSSISVADGRAYTMGNINKTTDVVFCFDAVSGKQRWRYDYAEDLDPHYYEGGCSATPTMADGKVYTISKTGKVFCLNAETGEVVWRKELSYETPSWGFSGSPLVQDGKVIFNLGQSGVALDKSTGEVIWESDNGKPGYATPVPYEKDSNELLAIFGADSIMGVNPLNGERLWSFPWKTQYDVNASDPIIHDNKVFITSGYGRGAALIDIAAAEPTPLWENKNMRSHMSGPVLIDGYLYGFDDAQLTCLDWQSGEQKWTETKPRKGALTAAGDKLIVIGETGTLFIVEASPEGYHEISSAEALSGGHCWTPPVLANGRIYVRNSKGQLVCMDVSSDES